MAQFKLIRCARGSRGFTLVEIMIVILITSVVIAIAAPTWFRQREKAKQNACQEILVQIDGAKARWFTELRKPRTETPDLSELWMADGSGFLKREPKCPSDGTYTLNDPSTPARCSITEEPFDHNKGR